MLDLLYNNTDDCNVFILFVHRSYNNMMCIGPTMELWKRVMGHMFTKRWLSNSFVVNLASTITILCLEITIKLF